MRTAAFHELDDYAFRHLVLDLLRAEGMAVTEPVRPADDILVSESVYSHRNATLNLRWRLYLAHQRMAQARLKPIQVERLLKEFDERRRTGEGLLLASDSEPDEEAWRLFTHYARRNPETRLAIWNGRQLSARLERQAHLQYRYSLRLSQHDVNRSLAPLIRFVPLRVLLISDQSAIAQDLHQALRSAGFEVVIVPFWVYSYAPHLGTLYQSLDAGPFDLVVCMLGDSFRRRLPPPLVDAIRDCYTRGGSVLFFPFMAMSLDHGRYQRLGDLIPVRQLQMNLFAPEMALERLAGPHRMGDYRWLIGFDTMAENAYNEFAPEDALSPFAQGISETFGLLHSYERLTLAPGATLAWADTAGNPFVALQKSVLGRGKSCYINTSCHRCLSPQNISSPLRASAPLGIVLLHALEWLLD